MAQRRNEEDFAVEVLHRVLGATVTQRDDGSTDRMVDALFTLPNGEEGALEVTTIGDPKALETENLSARIEWAVDGSRWTWLIHVGPAVSLRELQQHLAELVLTCERTGHRDPRELIRSQHDDPAFIWFDANEVAMHGFAETSSPGLVEVLPDGGGGAVFSHLDELPAWIEGRLGEPDLCRKLQKLARTGRKHQHLFVRVHETGMPFALYYPTAFGDALPATDLRAPPGLTGLWLAPRWANPLLRWHADVSWTREDCLD